MTALAVQNDLSDGLGDAWRTVAETVPKVLLFLVILLVGWLVARGLAAVLQRLLERVGFDRAAERGGLQRAFGAMTVTPSRLLGRLLYYALLLLTVQLAFGVFGPNPVSDLIAALVAYLPRVFIAIVIVVIAAAIASAAKELVRGALGGSDLGRWLAVAAQIAILVIGVAAALTQLGIAVVVTSSVLVAILATIGGILVVGLGGGLVRPMQRRWERWLDFAEQSTADAARARDAQRRHAVIEAEHERSLAAAAAAPPPPAEDTPDMPAVDPLSPEWHPPETRS